jgi:hypothetical protein
MELTIRRKNDRLDRKLNITYEWVVASLPKARYRLPHSKSCMPIELHIRAYATNPTVGPTPIRQNSKNHKQPNSLGVVDKAKIVVSAPRIELGTFRLQSNITVERDKPTTPSGVLRPCGHA